MYYQNQILAPSDPPPLGQQALQILAPQTAKPTLARIHDGIRQGALVGLQFKNAFLDRIASHQSIGKHRPGHSRPAHASKSTD